MIAQPYHNTLVPEASLPAAAPLAFDVKGLRVRLGSQDSDEVIQKLSASIPLKGVTCILGNSGSGKTVFTHSILGLLNGKPGILAGEVWSNFPGLPRQNLLEGVENSMSNGADSRLRREWLGKWKARCKLLWGTQLAYVTQHGKRAFDPTQSVAQSLLEAARLNSPAPKHQLEERIHAILHRLRFQNPKKVMAKRSKELSGGQAQRMSIALALIRGASYIVADEPSSGLDTAAQNALLDLLYEAIHGDIHEETQRLHGLIFITHELDLAKRLGGRTLIFNRGEVVEEEPTHRLFSHAFMPRSQTTVDLLREYRRLMKPSQESSKSDTDLEQAEVLRVVGLSKTWPSSFWSAERSSTSPLKNINFSLHTGEIVGLVGPSGVGKSTLGRCIAGLCPSDEGQVFLEDTEILGLSTKQRRHISLNLQFLLQQSTAALHPYVTVRHALMETATHLLHLPPKTARLRVNQLIQSVGLVDKAESLGCSLSGGQLRRVGIARALMLKPQVLIVDEPTASVDAYLKASILSLLRQAANTPPYTAVLMISHDIPALRHIADRAIILGLDGQLTKIPIAQLTPEVLEIPIGGYLSC